MNLNAQAREFKREKLLDAAIRLFSERGYANTSVEEVARSLGVTKPYVYRYFKNKEALLVAMYERVTDRIVALLEEAVATPAPPEEQFARFIESFTRENMSSVEFGLVYMQESKTLDPAFRAKIAARQKHFDRVLAALIQRGIDAGVFQVRDASLAGLAITGMVRWLQVWFRPGGRLSQDEIASQFKDMAMNALCYRPADGPDLPHA